MKPRIANGTKVVIKSGPHEGKRAVFTGRTKERRIYSDMSMKKLAKADQICYFILEGTDETIQHPCDDVALES